MYWILISSMLFYPNTKELPLEFVVRSTHISNHETKKDCQLKIKGLQKPAINKLVNIHTPQFYNCVKVNPELAGAIQWDRSNIGGK